MSTIPDSGQKADEKLTAFLELESAIANARDPS
jgi:hypothetical protein